MAIKINVKQKRKIFFFLLLGLMTALSGCKSHKKIHKDDPIEVSVIEINKNKKGDNKTGDAVANEARTWIGTPYRYGGQDKGKGTDCSGMVMVIYSEVAGVAIPRNSEKQAEFCDNLKENKVEAGDLVFFAIGKDKNKISHVGIMVDKLHFVHASASKGVIISDMTTPYYQRNFKKYGRVPR